MKNTWTDRLCHTSEPCNIPLHLLLTDSCIAHISLIIAHFTNKGSNNTQKILVPLSVGYRDSESFRKFIPNGEDDHIIFLINKYTEI